LLPPALEAHQLQGLRTPSLCIKNADGRDSLFEEARDPQDVFSLFLHSNVKGRAYFESIFGLAICSIFGGWKFFRISQALFLREELFAPTQGILKRNLLYFVLYKIY